MEERVRKKQLLDEVELFVLDMDGTFYCSDTLIEGSLEFLDAVRRRGKRFLFFTNNSSTVPRAYQKKLEAMGCAVDSQRIMTSGDVAIQYLKRSYSGKTVYLLGTPELREEFTRQGIALTEEQPDIVMVGFDKTLTYDKLERACTYIRQGAVFLSTHQDINCPVTDGFIPDSGAICAAISLSTGVSPRYLGKPHRETADMILEREGVSMENTAFVGDRLYTDIAAGVNNGAKGFLVLSGETKEADLVQTQVTPDAVFENLAEMGRILNDHTKGE